MDAFFFVMSIECTDKSSARMEQDSAYTGLKGNRDAETDLGTTRQNFRHNSIPPRRLESLQTKSFLYILSEQSIIEAMCRLDCVALPFQESGCIRSDFQGWGRA